MNNNQHKTPDELLNEFENLKGLEVGNTWEEQLFKRVETLPRGKAIYSYNRYTILLLLLVGINIAFLLGAFRFPSPSSLREKNNAYIVIEKQFFAISEKNLN